MAKIYIMTFIYSSGAGAISLRYNDAKEARENYLDAMKAFHIQVDGSLKDRDAVWAGSYQDGEVILRLKECIGIMLAELEQPPDLTRYANLAGGTEGQLQN